MPKPTWDKLLRQQLKLEHGKGWQITEQSGRTKLTRRLGDGSRSSVMLNHLWAPSSASAITASVAQLRVLMDERNLRLREAAELNSAPAAPAANGAIEWRAVADAFYETRKDRRRTTQRDLRRRVEAALRTIATRPKPRDGRSLMRAYAAQHFDRCPPGGQGRKRGLGDVSAFLEFAVHRAGAPSQWLPLKGDELAELVGVSDRPCDDELTPPIKPEQLGDLLDAIQAMGREDLWLAVALVGLYGLRPAELAVLSVRDGRLHVGGEVKRNISTMRKPKGSRLVMPLDIPGREGEGEKAMHLLDSELVKLPQRIRTATASGEFHRVGNAFYILLRQVPYWVSLTEATPGLTPYSLRHGWAWRAHKGYERSLSIRDAAKLLGHDPSTHHKHYGKWTDEAGLIEAVQRLQPAKTLAKPG